MIRTIYNVLSEEGRQEIKRLADYEIDNHLNTDVPLYQSKDRMHEKYNNNPHFSSLIKNVLEKASISCEIVDCWFNICKKGSSFPMHTHDYVDYSAVFFIEGCEDNGTIFNINNTVLKVIAKDNSLIYFDSTLEHTIPPWDNIDRYSIAFDLIKL